MQIITTHENAGFDGLAAMIAAQKIYTKARLVFLGSKNKSLHDFISQHLSFNYEFMSADSINTKNISNLIAVKARSTNKLGLLKKCDTNKIKFYKNGSTPADNIHLFNYGACTTIFVRKIQEEAISITAEEATIFALGIYSETKSFTKSGTQPEDIYAAGWLLEQGAKLDIIAHFIEDSLGASQEEIIREIKQNADIFTIQQFPVTISSFTWSQHINDFNRIVRNYSEKENINCLFAILETEGRIHLVAHSRITDIDVGAIARDLGGDGHNSDASATINNLKMTEVEEQLIEALHRHVQPLALASEMMTSPAHFLPPHICISAANDTLTRYNVTAMPVVDNDKIVGSISRHVIEKALHHDLGDITVSSYMSTEIKTLGPEATLTDLQELIAEQRQRLVPITNMGKLIGIVTRTDLLDKLVNKNSNHKGLIKAEKGTPNVAVKHNIKILVHKQLTKKIITLLETIGSHADEMKLNAFAVGGFVRDLLLKRPNEDLDIVIEGNGIEFAKQLAIKLKGKCLAHDKFLTAVVTLPDGFKVDIATARLEYYDSPASLPMVQLSSIKHDLSRRDFTINAMALQINSKNFGTLIDFYNSQNDLNDRAIRILHNLSFVEDPSRIFRAIRFESRMNFHIGQHTERLINNAVTMNLFGKSRDSRFLNELKIIFKENDPITSLLRLAELQFFQFLWPDLRPSYRITRRFTHMLKQAKKAIFLFKEYEPKSGKVDLWMVYLLAIYHSSGIEELEAFCSRFKENIINSKKLFYAKSQGDFLRARMDNRINFRPSQVDSALSDENHETLLYVWLTAKKTRVQKYIYHYISNTKQTKSFLTGRDLMEIGYKPGPKFSEILSTLRAARIDGLTSSKEDEIRYLEEINPKDLA
ncbi:MAG: CBS domain-containing protein [Desulfotalea sp.]